jgi:arsenate reductase
MAEGWMNALFPDRLEAFSAGSNPAGSVHPLAIRVMAEAGIDISGARSKHLNEFLGQPFDTVMTVCDPARDACPVFPGRADRVHHTFYDPAEATGTEEERLAVFRRVRDEIRAWLEEYFNGIGDIGTEESAKRKLPDG